MGVGAYATMTGMDTQTLRQRLTERRGQLNALAVAAGVDRATIRRIINRAGYVPRLDTAERIIAALRIIRPPRRSS